MDDDKNRLKTKTYKDYYQILKIRPDATAEQIETAYGNMYEKFGPNSTANGLDAESLMKIFRDITDAYEVLSDPVKRRDYDRNTEKSRQQVGDVRALWAKVTSPTSSANGEPEKRAPEVQALSLELITEVTLKEAIKGGKRVYDISDPTPCEDCAGMKPVTRMQCGTCRGLGYFNVDRKEEVDLPGGMYDGMEIRKAELGRYDLRAGKYGDLVLRIKIREHPQLALNGNDITCTVPVTLYEAVLGAEIEVPTATGRVMMKIQQCTQPGRIYRLKGLGLAGADQLVAIDVVLPSTLTAEDLAHFRKLRELYKGPNPRDSNSPNSPVKQTGSWRPSS
jgi:DnaJ-class molecular chaperone